MTRARLGILMLETRFPRFLGDVGNPDSFPFPVQYLAVPGATPEAIVLDDPRPWVDAFIEAGHELAASGCTGLATTCGFLTLVRDQVQKACGVPVASSSLEQVAPLVAAGRTPGILTISAKSLSPQHLSAVDVPVATPVQGVDGGHFATAILENRNDLDPEKSRAEMVAGAEALCTAHPELDCIVLECTNMPPYADEITRATGLQVFSILTHLTQFHATL